MEAKNVILLGFVNKALDYLGKHLDDELDASLMELKNIDLEGLKAQLNEEMNASLDRENENVNTLMDAGKEAFDKFMKANKEEDLSSEFDRMFDVDLDTDEASGKKDELEELLAFYNLSDDLGIKAFENDEEQATDEELPAEEEAVPAIEETLQPEEIREETEPEERKQEEAVAEPVSEDENEASYELNDEESMMLQMIAKNVNKKPDALNEVPTGASSQLDMIFSELVAAEEEIDQIDTEEEKEEEKKEEVKPVEKPVIILDEKTREALSQYIENPLIDEDIPVIETEEEEEREPNPDLIFPEQIDKNDIIKLVKEIQPMSDVYYNKIESFIDSQEALAQQQKAERPKSESKYVSSLIDDLKNKMSAEEQKKRAAEEAYRQVYDKIHKSYPYLSNAFIRNVYDLKETIATEYPLGKNIIVLHRSVFRNVENLRQYVEIALKHDYMLNADEKKMIVDVFKPYVNTDGKIITSIFEVANQSALLDGEYEGYRVLFEEDL